MENFQLFPAERIGELLQPYIPDLPAGMLALLNKYLDLLLRWNARTNLTAVRTPSEIITRHFGESLFVADRLSPGLPNGATLLDFGSGAGFPGIPIQIFRPDLRVTLAESQHKKAAFLREVVRTLGLPTLVHAARAETLSGKAFDCVTLRAVDHMAAATAEAAEHLRPDGLLALMATSAHPLQASMSFEASYPIPCSRQAVLTLFRSSVPQTFP